MPDIPFTCPHCDHFAIVEERFAGQTGPCTNCGIATTVPRSPDAADEKKALEDVERRDKEALPVLLSSLGVMVGIVALVLVGAVAVVWPMVVRREHGKKIKSCSANMARIGMALMQYHQDYGAYPPPYIRDAKGKPLLSWRVLLLPYLGDGGQKVYASLDRTKAWNHPRNRSITSKPFALFTCPLGQPGKTNHMAITGRGTVFDPTRKTSKTNVKDGLARTICIVEVASSPIGWAEPVDLDINRISFKVNATPGKDISSQHRGGVCHATCCDGTVRSVHRTTKSAILRAMATIDGGESGIK